MAKPWGTPKDSCVGKKKTADESRRVFLFGGDGRIRTGG